MHAFKRQKAATETGVRSKLFSGVRSIIIETSAAEAAMAFGHLVPGLMSQRAAAFAFVQVVAE